MSAQSLRVCSSAVSALCSAVSASTSAFDLRGITHLRFADLFGSVPTHRRQAQKDCCKLLGFLQRSSLRFLCVYCVVTLFHVVLFWIASSLIAVALKKTTTASGHGSYITFFKVSP